MKSTKILRQNVGIDMGKSNFIVRHTTMDMEGNIRHTRPRTFPNNPSGYKAFLKWAESVQVPDIEMRFTMEATGVYYEGLAYFLYEQGKYVSVLLPNMVKKFNESLNTKSKTDAIDAKILGQIGVERLLPKWKISSKIFRKLRKLTRQRQRLVKAQTMAKNQLHAEKHSGDPMEIIIKQLQEHIHFLNRQVEAIEKKLKELVAQDTFVSRKIKKITTIPGVGFITVVSIIAETQGFANFTSLKQVWSYSGYDVRQRQSGKYKGRTRISKKGNRYIRGTMYMPTLSSIKHNKTYSKFYTRLKERKGESMIALVAVQRKLLGLIYTLWKNDTEFIENYYEKVKKGSGSQTPTTQDRQGFHTETCLPSAYTKIITLKKHNNENNVKKFGI